MAARAQTSELTTEQLQKEIRDRDAVIQSLIQRVEKLERQVGTGASATAGPAAGPKRSVAKSQAGARSSPPAIATLAPAEPPPAEPTATPATSNASPASSAGTTQQAADTNPPAPGQLQVSAAAAERALERTLVATGNLLVPKGFAEIQPIFSYSRREVPTQIAFDVNRNELSWTADMRFGLPWESQFEISAPYNFMQQQVTSLTGPLPEQVSNGWGNSFGDVTVGLAKTVVHESGWIPDVIGRITYEIPTGPESSNQVPLPSDRSLLGFSLTALKRQDPLVFVATGGYSKSFRMGQLNPGDQFNFQTGVFLASSPETTLRTVLQQTFVKPVSIDGVTFKGSDTDQTILNFGASSILGRGILVDLQVGAGLTSSAPKYSVILSGTYRFGLPGL